MNEKANTAMVRRCYEMFSSGDISELVEHLSADIAFSVPEVENSPSGGIWYGRDEVTRYFEILELAEETTDYEVREFIAEGDRVVVLGRSTATVRATGRHYSTEWVHVHTIKDNLITNFAKYFDTAAALRAFQKVTTALT
ncbi:MAG: nuclear transport factor 2 family protein [Pyrinomonadaceae bacterium]